MKRVIAAFALTLFCSSFAAAHHTDVVLTAKNGNVTFAHKTHPGIKCTTCHETEAGGKIVAMDKDWAHKTCKGCHESKGKGPTKCSGCHKK